MFAAGCRKLAHLIDSEKEETARKACVDVISLWHNDDAQQVPEKTDCQNQTPQLSQEKAAKIWAVLAEKEEKQAAEQSSNIN